MLAVLFDNDLELNESFFDKVTQKKCTTNIEYFVAMVDCVEALFVKIKDTSLAIFKELTYLKRKFDIDKIILTGNTASTDSADNINSLAIGHSTFDYSVDFSALGLPPFAKPDQSYYSFATDSLMTALTKHAAKQMQQPFFEGIFASADKFLADSGFSSQLNANFGVRFVDTQSATVGNFAHQNKIPFCIVKGISNYADDNAPITYNANKAFASLAAFKTALKMICLTCGNKDACPYFINLSPEETLETVKQNKQAMLSFSFDNVPYAAPMSYTSLYLYGKLFLILYNYDKESNVDLLTPLQSVSISISDDTRKLKGGFAYKTAVLTGSATAIDLTGNNLQPFSQINLLPSNQQTTLIDFAKDFCGKTACFDNVVLFMADYYCGKDNFVPLNLI